MRTFVIVFMALAVANSNAASESYRAYSSCSMTGDTDWVKAKPYKLKSWLGSIVPGISMHRRTITENLLNFNFNGKRFAP